MARPFIVWDGIRWHQRKDGYFASSRRGLLHRAIYAAEHGPIPPGMDVHHKDLDKSNNDPSNLVLGTPGWHWQQHHAQRGADWHRLGGIASVAARPIRTDTCIMCGTAFEHRGSGPAKFCSPKCRDRGAPSRAPTERVCIVCGKRFTAPKRRATKTCSYPCRAQHIADVKRARRAGL